MTALWSPACRLSNYLSLMASSHAVAYKIAIIPSLALNLFTTTPFPIANLAQIPRPWRTWMSTPLPSFLASIRRSNKRIVCPLLGTNGHGAGDGCADGRIGRATHFGPDASTIARVPAQGWQTLTGGPGLPVTRADSREGARGCNRNHHTRLAPAVPAVHPSWIPNATRPYARRPGRSNNA